MALKFFLSDSANSWRESLLFTDDDRITAIVENEARNSCINITPQEIAEQALCRHGKAVKDAMQTFPNRHRTANRTAVQGDHSEWLAKFEAVKGLIGTGAIIALLGPRGTGKTQLATATARWGVETRGMGDLTRQAVRYAVLGELLASIKATFSGNGGSESDILAPLTRCNLLVLDECHECNGSEWAVRVLTLLIDARYRERRDTIMIANLTPEELLAAVGPSVASRMDECGYFVMCEWQSLRGASR